MPCDTHTTKVKWVIVGEDTSASHGGHHGDSCLFGKACDTCSVKGTRHTRSHQKDGTLCTTNAIE